MRASASSFFFKDKLCGFVDYLVWPGFGRISVFYSFEAEADGSSACPNGEFVFPLRIYDVMQIEASLCCVWRVSSWTPDLPMFLLSYFYCNFNECLEMFAFISNASPRKI